MRLFVDERDVAPLEVASSGWQRARGLLGRSGLDGGLWFPGVRSVHTIGMRFVIDVAFVDASSVVVDVVTMSPHRFGRARRSASAVLEASAGSFENWGLGIGSKVEAR